MSLEHIQCNWKEKLLNAIIVHFGAPYIMMDGEETKLELFADDLTAFLLNDNSLLKFFEFLKSCGECSGLKLNHDKGLVKKYWGLVGAERGVGHQFLNPR